MIIRIHKSSLITLVVLFIVSIIAITIIFNSGAPAAGSQAVQNTNSSISSTTGTTNTASGSSQRQTTTMGVVTVDVDPLKLGRTEAENSFTVSFNSHSVNLDVDFTKLITLRDDTGNTYQAKQWTGNRGGHHISGDIIFPRLNGTASQVTLKISGIDGQTKDFTWPVQ